MAMIDVCYFIDIGTVCVISAESAESHRRQPSMRDGRRYNGHGHHLAELFRPYEATLLGLA